MGLICHPVEKPYYIRVTGDGRRPTATRLLAFRTLKNKFEYIFRRRIKITFSAAATKGFLFPRFGGVFAAMHFYGIMTGLPLLLSVAIGHHHDYWHLLLLLLYQSHSDTLIQALTLKNHGPPGVR